MLRLILIIILVAANISHASSKINPKPSKPMSWSIELNPTVTVAPTRQWWYENENENRKQTPNGGINLNISQDSLFDELRENPTLAKAAQQTSWTFNPEQEVGSRYASALKAPAQSANINLTHWPRLDGPSEPIEANYLAQANLFSRQSAAPTSQFLAGDQLFPSSRPQSSFSLEPQNYLDMAAPKLVQARTSNPAQNQAPQLFIQQATRMLPMILDPPSRILAPSNVVEPRGFRLNPFISSSKRRSHSSRTDNVASKSSKMSTLQDALEAAKQGELDLSDSLNSIDLLASLNTLPVIFDSTPSVVRRSTKIRDDLHDSSMTDNLIASSKYMGHISHHPMSTLYDSYPSYSSYKYSSPMHRKGLEKSLGVPILLGIGAALISFLIISNLFLSIPLFAMTLMQFLNGNNMIMPNVFPPNNNNNNNQNGQVPRGRRRRRDIHASQLELRIEKAIAGVNY